MVIGLNIYNYYIGYIGAYYSFVHIFLMNIFICHYIMKSDIVTLHVTKVYFTANIPM